MEHPRIDPKEASITFHLAELNHIIITSSNWSYYHNVGTRNKENLELWIHLAFQEDRSTEGYQKSGSSLLPEQSRMT